MLVIGSRFGLLATAFPIAAVLVGCSSSRGTGTGTSASTDLDASAGGAPPSDGGDSSGSDLPMTSCTFTVESSVSTAIPTVGIVEWSTSLDHVDGATIDFGLTTEYGLSASVDLERPGYRTLLLGMKPSSTYHFRITATGDGKRCASEDRTVKTGARATGLGTPTLSPPSTPAAAGGYKVTGSYLGGKTFILDADGDYVWWFDSGEVTRARQSFDGESMWIAKGNVPRGEARVVRVSMDGLDVEDYSAQFEGCNHDLTVLPDETVAFIAYSEASGCDRVSERAPDGMVRDVVANACDLLGVRQTHVNAIHYARSDDTLIISELDSNSYTKIDRSGNLIWTLGGSRATISGNYGWDGNHGFHILREDRLLIFNNGSTGSGSASRIIELVMNDGSASRAWEYESADGMQNTVMGDVQRLLNGNTLITYSTRGVVQELDANGNLIQELGFGLGTSLGYLEHRMSLYGPPPR